MRVPGPSSRQPKPLAAGVFQPEIGSFRLCLAAEGKSGKTVRMYTEAVQWFAAAHLIPQTSHARREQVSGQDIQRWLVWLPGRLAIPMPATSTAPCSSSANGGPVRKIYRTRWPGSGRLNSCSEASEAARHVPLREPSCASRQHLHGFLATNVAMP